MPTIGTFDDIEINHDVYKGKHCIKKFCECLREYKVKIIDFVKKKMISFTKSMKNIFIIQTATFAKKVRR